MTYPTDPASRPQSSMPPMPPVSESPTDVSDTAGPLERPTVPPVEDRPVPAPEATDTRPAPGFDQKGRVRRTRVSGVWIGLIATALFLILLVIFIAQNSRTVSIHFFGWHGNFSLALTILLAAIAGVLLVAIPGSVRILQLRRALRKNVPAGRRS